MTTAEKQYRFARGRCGRCGTILAEERAVIAAPDMRLKPHGECPDCKKLLPLVVEEEPEPEPESEVGEPSESEEEEPTSSEAEPTEPEVEEPSEPEPTSPEAEPTEPEATA